MKRGTLETNICTDCTYLYGTDNYLSWLDELNNCCIPGEQETITLIYKKYITLFLFTTKCRNHCVCVTHTHTQRERERRERERERERGGDCYDCGGTRDVMLIVVGNGHGDTSSNLERD